MSFSSVLGASSVIKPGVCTSTTRPSVPYEGQLIYETDTDRVASYNGSAWVYTHSSGLVYITGASFTAVSSVSLANNTFSSTYRNYRVFFQVTSVTSDADITLRLRASGSDNTTTNYRTAGAGAESGTASGVFVCGNAQSSFDLDEMDVTFPASYVFDAISPQVATSTFIHGEYGTFRKTPNGMLGINFSGHFDGTTQFDSLTLISSVASSMTGVYRVYGYADS